MGSPGGGGGGRGGAGSADHVFYTAGAPHEGTMFGGYMSGHNSNNVRGFWQITVAAPQLITGLGRFAAARTKAAAQVAGEIGRAHV